jgi:hypothetical protein
MPVECSNCGGGVEVWVAIASLVIALASLIVSIFAAKEASRSANVADQSLTLTRKEVAIASEQHDVFLRELRARARFELIVRTSPQPDDDDVIRSDGTGGTIIIEVILKNVGEREAGETVLNVIAPRFLGGVGFRWSGPQGEPKEDASPPAPTPEELIDADGETYPAQYLAKVYPTVTRRNAYASFVALYVDFPSEGQRRVPLRISAAADELPEDEAERSEDLTIRLARRREESGSSVT